MPVIFLKQGYLCDLDGNEGKIDQALTFESIENLKFIIGDMEKASYLPKNSKYSIMKISTQLTEICELNNELSSELIATKAEFESQELEKKLKKIDDIKNERQNKKKI